MLDIEKYEIVSITANKTELIIKRIKNKKSII